MLATTMNKVDAYYLTGGGAAGILPAPLAVWDNRYRSRLIHKKTEMDETRCNLLVCVGNTAESPGAAPMTLESIQRRW